MSNKTEKNHLKIYPVTLGCDKNRVDTERMLSILSSEGYTFTYDEDEADIALVNTCCFINDAKLESVQTLLELADRKASGQLRALIVTGCLAEKYREDIRKEIPEVDSVLGITAEENVAIALDKALSGVGTEFFDDINKAFKVSAGRTLTTGGYYAYMKIAEGCDKGCTYCIIPSLRGRYRSVPKEALIREANSLAERGVRELILVAQETTLYGTDIYGKKMLPELLDEIAEIEGISRIRILYCYPEEIDDELIAAIKRNEKVANYLDLPLQSGSDAILRKMGRRTTNSEIRKLVTKLRREIPDICLRTTLITGFPGETARDQKQTLELVRDIEFDRLGVFTYSKEDDTPAARMHGHISETLKKRRRTQIMKLQQEIVFRKAESHVGKLMDVIVDGGLDEKEDDERVYVGRTHMDAPDVDGMIFFTGGSREYISGELVRVKVTNAIEYDLVGKAVKVLN